MKPTSKVGKYQDHVNILNAVHPPSYKQEVFLYCVE